MLFDRLNCRDSTITSMAIGVEWDLPDMLIGEIIDRAGCLFGGILEMAGLPLKTHRMELCI